MANMIGIGSIEMVPSLVYTDYYGALVQGP